MPDTIRYLTDKDLAKRYSVTRTCIWVWAKQGKLPKPIRLSPQCTRWLLHEVDEMDAARLAAARSA